MTESLYKIYGPKDRYQYFKEVIKENKIYLSRLSQLNDPFDCVVTYDFENASEADFARYCIERNYHMSHSKKQLADEFPKYMREALDPKLGLYCMTSCISSPPMWAHYGANHNGVAIEFDRGAFSSLSESQGCLGDVQYEDKFPSVADYLALETDRQGSRTLAEMNLHLFRKCSHWKYEQEVRYVRLEPNGYTNETRKVECPDRAIKGVYFGAAIELSVRSELVELVRGAGHGLRMYVMEVGRSGYLMESQEIYAA